MDNIKEPNNANIAAGAPGATAPAIPAAEGFPDWQQRVILGRQVGAMELPPWLHDAYATLRKHVMDPAYPCFFGTMAEKRGEMFYSYVNGKDIGQLAATMTTFSELAKLPAYEKNNIAIFFEPDAVPLSHQQYHDHFWDTLQHLHLHDPDPEADHQPPPHDPKWEFSFAGVEMFVVCACPSFAARHSRNLGPGMVLLFQPRSVFVDKVTNRVIGLQAREEVRRRLKKWDALPAHPDLGFYGDPGNLEWKQYFLPDDNVAHADKCPFLSRSTQHGQQLRASAQAHGPQRVLTAPAPQAAPASTAAAASPATATVAATAPTRQQMLEISQRYAGLPEARRKVFRSALQEKQIPTALLPIVPLAGRSQRMPLSDAQERLWFLWQMAPGNSAYNMPNAVRLHGALEPGAVRAAIGTIVARHEILRTTFTQTEQTPWQLIHDDLPFDYQEVDLRAQPAGADAAEAASRQALRQWALAPFDLERGPLLRVGLVRLRDDEHVLQLVLHHIVGDAGSHTVLAREFLAAYEAATAGRAHGLPPLALQYADVAAWQKEWNDQPATAQQLAYWRQRLGHEHPVLTLPGARQRHAPANDRRQGGWITRQAGVAQLTRLKHLADEYGTTSFAVLLALYDSLLYRYSGQRDIRVGVPVAGRDRSETETLIGFFVNTLVLRAEVDGATRFDHLLAQVHNRMLEAQANQDLPFARLVDALQPERSLNSTPLFQVMFNHAQSTAVNGASAGLKLSPVEVDQDSVKFDLNLNVHEYKDGIALSFAYALQQFDGTLIEAMADDYVHLLEQVLARPATPLGSLRLASAPAPAPDTAAAGSHSRPPAFRSLAQRVRETAERKGDALALHCEGERMDYRTLVRQADRVAGRLRTLQVQPDECVGVCVERSGAMVAAILGILQAGSAFVPLDPSYPQERLNFMLGNAGIRRVVADPNTMRKFPDLLEDFEVIALGADDGELPAQPPVTAWPAIHPEQLAYVIYTSGSTGKPKGVAVSHRALALHMEDFIATHGISERDKVLHVSTINFDVALHEIFPVLIQGGSLVMRGPRPWDLEATNRHLVEQGVTFSRLPTAYWQQWLRNLPDAGQLRLRQITVGGEALNGDTLRSWKSSPLAHIAVANLYGPTETTVACMHHQTTTGDGDDAIVAIGQAYPSRRVHVMDDDGNVVPAMVDGELCIGGTTLARGYMGRPDLTAEKFVPNPFGAPGGRLYRSGDVCRARADGTVDYLGRRDKQVKLRGFRIELGEIENLLRSAPGIGEAVVELVGEGAGARLVAFVTGQLHKAEVTAFLQRQLPDYMVPATFVTLERMPLMQNGKLDRHALLQADFAIAPRHNVEPRNELETVLLGIWREVLDKQQFGVTDNFFDLGGNSLSALRVAAMARNRGIAGFSLQALFRHPTIAALAEQCQAESSGRDGASMATVALNSAGATHPTLFVLPPSSGLALDYRTLAQHLAGSVNVVGLQVPLEQPASSWPQDMAGLARYHIACMRGIQPAGPYRLLGWSLGGTLAVEIAYQLECAGEQLDFVGIVDAKTPAQRIADRQGKNRDLQRQDSVLPDELEAFWQDLRRQDQDMAHWLQAQDPSGQMAGNIVLASNYLALVSSLAEERCLAAGLHLWWSAESPQALWEGWSSSTHGRVHQVRQLEVSHRAIVKDVRLADDLRQLLAAPAQTGGNA